MVRHQISVESWRHPGDLAYLRHCFYADFEYQDDGCKLVAVWNSKGRVPHVVTATAELTQALLQEAKGYGTASAQVNNFCTAWVRFVNGMTDIQQQYKSKQSMYQIARQLNLPASFIELRHRAVHEDKPTIRELSRAAKQGLSWLFAWYWTHIPDHQGVIYETNSNSYDQLSPDDVRTRVYAYLHINPGDECQRHRDQYAGPKSAIYIRSLRASTKLVIDLCGSSWERTKVASPIICAALTTEAVVGENKDSAAFSVYDDLLLQMANSTPGCLFSFQYALLACITTPEPDASKDQAKGAVAWLSHLYTAPAWDKFRQRGELDLKLALQLCSDNHSPWSKQLVELISEETSSVPMLENSKALASQQGMGRASSKNPKLLPPDIDDGRQDRVSGKRMGSDKLSATRKRPYRYSAIEFDSEGEPAKRSRIASAGVQPVGITGPH